MPRFSSLVAAAALAAGCSSPSPTVEAPLEKDDVARALALPATYMSTPSCPGCLALTVTLRPDGSYLGREQLGAAEFYDFGRWRLNGETLELTGGRDQRRHALSALRRAAKVEPLQGPFRLIGLYDGRRFRECRTGVAWEFTATRAAENLRREFGKQQANPAVVALDAQFEGAPERLRMFRPATLLSAQGCPD